MRKRMGLTIVNIGGRTLMDACVCVCVCVEIDVQQQQQQLPNRLSVAHRPHESNEFPEWIAKYAYFVPYCFGLCLVCRHTHTHTCLRVCARVSIRM